MFAVADLCHVGLGPVGIATATVVGGDQRAPFPSHQRGEDGSHVEGHGSLYLGTRGGPADVAGEW
jgi:hypothetical protein